MNQRAQDPHHPLNQLAEDPDPTEWPDPYDRRPDPLDPNDADADPGQRSEAPGAQQHERRPLGAAPGATSTSEPHPREDPEAIPAEEPKRDRIDR